MTSRESKKNAPSPADRRRDRLAAELRANLKKRRKRARGAERPAQDDGATNADEDTGTEKPE